MFTPEQEQALSDETYKMAGALEAMVTLGVLSLARKFGEETAPAAALTALSLVIAVVAEKTRNPEKATLEEAIDKIADAAKMLMPEALALHKASRQAEPTPSRRPPFDLSGIVPAGQA